jgi:tetratricopeptide (TPR) repeat protein
MKKRVILIGLTLWLGACAAPPTKANLADLARLRRTGSCPRCNLRGASLQFYPLHRANLEGADLTGADLSQQDLRAANLSRANLEGANLSRANLEGADLRNTNLKRSNLVEANFFETKLDGADLEGAIANFTQGDSAPGTVKEPLAIFAEPSFQTLIKTSAWLSILGLVSPFIFLLVLIGASICNLLPSFFYGKGLRSQKGGHYTQAIEQYNQALRFYRKHGLPSRVSILINRGQAYLDAGDYVRALADAEQVVKNARSASAYVLRGIVHLHLRNYQAAIEDYSEALKIDPQLALAWGERGRIWFLLDSFSRALEDYSQAIELSPDASYYLGCGAARYCLREYSYAIGSLTHAARLSPKMALAYFYRGHARYALNDMAIAQDDFRQAAAIDPMLSQPISAGYQEGYLARGLARTRIGQSRDAIADFNTVLRINPNHALAYQERGIARSYLGNYQLAIQDLSKTLSWIPCSRSYYYRGVMNTFLEQPAQAIADLTHAIRLYPNHVAAYYYRGNAYYEMGDRQAAIADFQKASDLKLAIQPWDGYELYAQGLALNRLGNVQGAIGAWQTAIALSLEYHNQALQQRLELLLRDQA